MANDGAVLRQVAWRELFPGLTIFRSFRVALDPRKIVLAALALFLTSAGWWLFGQMLGGSADVQRLSAQAGGLPMSAAVLDPFDIDASGWQFPWLGTWRWLASPFREMFSARLTIPGLVYLLLSGLWSLAVWALLGGMIARMAALELCCEENCSIKEAFHYARGKWVAFFSGPLFPLLGALALVVPMMIVGLFMRFGAGVLMAGIVWPLVLVAGLLMAILLAGLLFGWPLMWPTVAVDGGDSFESLSRSYGYITQRPGHYLLYVVVAGFVGALSWWFVMWFASLVISLSYWGASWGSGGQQMGNVIATTPSALQDLSGALGTFSAGATPLAGAGYGGARLLTFWNSIVSLLAVGFGFSYFWTSATAIYLVLRYHVDGAEIDEIHRDEDGEPYGLPKLESVPPATTAPPAAVASPPPQPAAAVAAGPDDPKPSSPDAVAPEEKTEG